MYRFGIIIVQVQQNLTQLYQSQTFQVIKNIRSGYWICYEKNAQATTTVEKGEGKRCCLLGDVDITVKTQLLKKMLYTYLLTCYMFRPMLGHHQVL
jgi:hypothetical protein